MRSRSLVPRCRVLVLLACVLTGTLGAPALAIEANQHGLSGSWTHLTAPGQGLNLEVYQDLVSPGYGFLQGGYFTYDIAPTGQQRWFTISGPTFTGQSAVPVTIYQNVGGNFAAPPATTSQAVGTGLVSFTDCNNATFTYTMMNGFQAGVIPLGRLTQNVSCVPTGNNEPSNLDFGLGGNWFMSSLPGQGFIAELNNVSGVWFMTWYTYLANGANAGAAGQYWMTVQGAYPTGARFLNGTIYETTGGMFNSSARTPVTRPIGTASLSFMTCQLANFSYSITTGPLAGRSGTQTLSRVAATPRYCF